MMNETIDIPIEETTVKQSFLVLGMTCASCAGRIDQLTKPLAIAYAKDGIRVNAVAPGWIDAPLLAPLKDTLAAGILAKTPFDRWRTRRNRSGSCILCITSRSIRNRHHLADWRRVFSNVNHFCLRL